MTITAKEVGHLRERTGAGLMECKRALEAAGGDIDAAIEAMRKAGQAKADKKAGRVAAEGIIVVKSTADNKGAVLVEINCETDFVAKDESFKQFADQVATSALAAKTTDVTKVLALPIAANNETTVEQARQALVAKIGENIQIRRVDVLQSDTVIGAYVHGGRIGVLVQLAGGDIQVAKDIAMHIAANNPQVIAQDEVPAELIAKEKEIFTAQAQGSGKPAAIIEKMVEGRVHKFLDEISLLGQPFVKNPDMTIAQLLKQHNATVVKFVRFAVGEGIEKQTENFVEAVMAQIHG